jgi:hypothetical protein
MHSYLKDNLYSYLQEGQDVGHVLQGCGQQFVCGQQGVGQGALHLGSHVGHTGVYPPQEGWQQDDGPQDGAQEEPQLDPHGPQEGPQLEPQQPLSYPHGLQKQSDQRLQLPKLNMLRIKSPAKRDFNVCFI